MVASRHGTGSLADFFRCHNFSKKVGSLQWLLASISLLLRSGFVELEIARPNRDVCE
jgi:hypothetical protein